MVHARLVGPRIAPIEIPVFAGVTYWRIRFLANTGGPMARGGRDIARWWCDLGEKLRNDAGAETELTLLRKLK